jgi:hypothetical protein
MPEAGGKCCQRARQGSLAAPCGGLDQVGRKRRAAAAGLGAGVRSPAAMDQAKRLTRSNGGIDLERVDSASDVRLHDGGAKKVALAGGPLSDLET